MAELVNENEVLLLQKILSYQTTNQLFYSIKEE